ncbi:dihydropyrimidinase-like [Limulus polyphemus]|uniref:dihydropyrimidinase n=1 Tax=Limulus polyphemus TaxID=6850 RepID=A0ABM1SIR8_LIMPO|nr:dihydropyrimidinase-like [Limulus polyphemus]
MASSPSSPYRSSDSEEGTPKPHRRPRHDVFFSTISDTELKSIKIGESTPITSTKEGLEEVQKESPKEIKEVLVAKEVEDIEAQPSTLQDWNQQNRLLIADGTIVNHDIMFDGDVYIEDGIVKEVGTDLSVPEGTRTINAKGKLVIPGGIDTQTNLEMNFMGARSMDDFYSGTKAALAGGTTMIMDFVMESSSSLLQSYEIRRAVADKKVCCDYALHIVLPEWTEKTEEEMEVLVKEKGINSFKAFMTYKDQYMLRDGELLQMLHACKNLGAVAMVHAENGDIIAENEKRMLNMGVTGPEGHIYSRPEEVEAEATFRASVLANQVNCPLFIQHVMSRSAAKVIAKRRGEGCLLYADTVAAALGTDGSHHLNACWRHAAGHVTVPPLCTDPSTPVGLMNLLGSGDLQVTASNHCTFSANQKALGQNDFTMIPHGVNGIEERMSVVWEKGVVMGILDPCRFVAVTSTNAAKIFNIYPRKGRIQVGSDADIVVWNPEQTRTISVKTHHSQADFNIFEGMECHGVADIVIAGGRVVVDQGQLQVTKGEGRFIDTPPFCPYIFSCVRAKDKACQPFKVEREPYESVAVEGDLEGETVDEAVEVTEIISQSSEFYSRPPTRSGGRNLQDSTFSLSGAQIDDDKDIRLSGKRIQNPPGGKSAGLW